ncbi:hypothetical protein HPP92_019866 [Vanilla planifolia]|uniref:Uncharacterized protein n=1 Tax=Vanilla planifolia TaxID=51239 RepID=A0A835Q9L9_VANPL|nr:hypothetical protein HPP92_019866 [Vanilla planifolia]
MDRVVVGSRRRIGTVVAWRWRCGVIIARGRRGQGIIWLRFQMPLADGQLDANFSLRSTGGAENLNRADWSRSTSEIFEVNEVLELRSPRANKGLGGFRGLGVEDIYG